MGVQVGSCVVVIDVQLAVCVVDILPQFAVCVSSIFSQSKRPTKVPSVAMSVLGVGLRVAKAMEAGG